MDIGNYMDTEISFGMMEYFHTDAFTIFLFTLLEFNPGDIKISWTIPRFIQTPGVYLLNLEQCVAGDFLCVKIAQKNVKKFEKGEQPVFTMAYRSIVVFV